MQPGRNDQPSRDATLTGEPEEGWCGGGGGLTVNAGICRRGVTKLECTPVSHRHHDERNADSNHIRRRCVPGPRLASRYLVRRGFS